MAYKYAKQQQPVICTKFALKDPTPTNRHILVKTTPQTHTPTNTIENNATDPQRHTHTLLKTITQNPHAQTDTH